jgi:transposase
MLHPKMQYTYVGIDSHKDTHTAVFLDCFFEKLGEISFGNLPSDFVKFLEESEKYKLDGTDFLFGLEDVSLYGRGLAQFLVTNNHPVKHVNAYLVAGERKNQNYEKSDSIDGECAARVLISKFGKLPDAEDDERYHILRTLVVRRDFVAKGKVTLKTYLHSLLTLDFPHYHKFFSDIDGKTSLEFFSKYPSPDTLKDVTAEELGLFLAEHSGGKLGLKKAMQILLAIGETPTVHEMRKKTIRGAIQQLQYNLQELENIEVDLAKVYNEFGTTLTSMAGLDLASASKMLSCIGDIRKFSSPAKLAKYAGVAPGSSSSGKNNVQFASKRGDRELNNQFYRLATRLIITYDAKHEEGAERRANNPFFYHYYHRKREEGKTKAQALKCVQRRLVGIIWTMLTNNEEYVNPPMIAVEKKEIKNNNPNI